MKFVIHADPELAELIPGYLLHREEDVKALHAALFSGDYALIERLGHTMKGSGGGYGFNAISEIGERMEEAAHRKNPEEIQKELKKLEEYLAGVEVIYRK